MFKVSRKSEYALMSVQHMARLPAGCVVSVTDLAAAEHIPADVLAKVLQGLKRSGILAAIKGNGGGYQLARPIAEIRFLDVVAPFEEQLGVVSCQNAPGGCEREGVCKLRDPMGVLNVWLMQQFSTLTMELFVANSGQGDNATLATAIATSHARRRASGRLSVPADSRASCTDYQI